MTQPARTADCRNPDELREAMADKLVSGGWITSPEVEAAFRAVPRHLFVPHDTAAASSSTAAGSWPPT